MILASIGGVVLAEVGAFSALALDLFAQLFELAAKVFSEAE